MQMAVPSRVVNPSVLREWEEMHRPPPLDQPILPSGPVRGRVVVGMMSRQGNMLNKNRRMTCVEQIRRQWRRWQGRREGLTSTFTLTLIGGPCSQGGGVAPHHQNEILHKTFLDKYKLSVIILEMCAEILQNKDITYPSKKRVRK